MKRRNRELDLTVQAVLAGLATDWIRVAQYEKGHRVSPTERTSARCGAPLIPDLTWWEETYRPNMQREFGVDPGEWYIQLDIRKGGKCTQCKGDDVFGYLARSTAAKYVEALEYAEVPESTPARRLADAQLDAAFGRIVREFDAEEVIR